jgi:hypothetical protein
MMKRGHAAQLSGGRLPWKPYMPWRSQDGAAGPLGSRRSTIMLSLPVRAIAMAFAIQAAAASTAVTSCKGQDAKQFSAEPTRTSKERLGGKASDEQRVDNCKVPPELRGSRPRPDDCPDAASTTPTR